MNNLLSLSLVLVLTIVWILVVIGYCKGQNNSGKIGGEISFPKSFWLGFALYMYSIFPIAFLLIYWHEKPWRWLLFLVISIILFRTIVQSYMMYISKNWRTNHGVGFNISTALILLSFTLYLVFGPFNFWALSPKSPISWFYIIYALTMVSTLLTDSFYAWEFGKLVGKDTMGDEAIWFASNDSKFDRINSITRRNNIIFILAIIVIFGIYIFNYDKF